MQGLKMIGPAKLMAELREQRELRERAAALRVRCRNAAFRLDKLLLAARGGVPIETGVNTRPVTVRHESAATPCVGRPSGRMTTLPSGEVAQVEYLTGGQVLSVR